jgi:hypothetical protein
MARFSKQLQFCFIFGFWIGIVLYDYSNSEFNSNENSITLVNSLRGGGKSESNPKPAFVQSPPVPDKKYSGEQPTKSQDFREMPPKFGYRTELAGGKKLPDNPGGGGSWGANNPDDEFAWKNVQKDPEMWSNYQEYCQYQSKKKQSCDLIEIKSRIKENPALVKFAEDAGKDPKVQRDLNNLIEQLRLGNESPGIGTKTLFKGVKEARTKSGARVYF